MLLCVIPSVLSVFKDFPLSRFEIAVLVSGFVSIGLEIVAGRVLAPSFGSSIYTWGSIIGVSLLALSLGYHRGGRLASRVDETALDHCLLYTALYVALLTVFGDYIVTFTAALPISPRYAAILPVTLLFGPPTYILGFVSPYAAELSKRTGEGAVSGHFYAVGTAGSLLGAFGTTFLLIPWLSTTTIYIVFAVIAALPLIRGWYRLQSYTVIVVVLVALLASSTTVVGQGRTVYETTTAYQELRVADNNGVRTLYLDGHPQSSMYIDNRTGYPWGYPRYFHVPLLMREDVSRVLFIGGGGFSGPKQYASMNITTDVVELDPGVIDAATSYFNVSESEHLRIFEGDGRAFLQDRNVSYDVIFLDAYRKSTVPFHLTTKEFMELTYEKTDASGIVFSNTIGVASGPGSEFPRAQYKTIDDVYRSTYYFPQGNSGLAQNIEIIGSKQPRLSEQALLERSLRHDGLDLSREVRGGLRPRTDDVPLLTDMYAPVDRLLEPLVSREYTGVS